MLGKVSHKATRKEKLNHSVLIRGKKSMRACKVYMQASSPGPSPACPEVRVHYRLSMDSCCPTIGTLEHARIITVPFYNTQGHASGGTKAPLTQPWQGTQTSDPGPCDAGEVVMRACTHTNKKKSIYTHEIMKE